MRGISVTVLSVAGLLAGPLSARADDTVPREPVWWFGVAGAANLNFYEGTTQQLNDARITPAPFHKGFGIGPYFAPVLEYRPNPRENRWGAILQLGYDDRRGVFDDATCTCGTLSLRARPAYLSLEPSLRFAPFLGNLHLFAGPRLGILWSPSSREKTYYYERTDVVPERGTFSKTRGTVFSAQAGAGYDFTWIPGKGTTRIQLSPLISYHPYFGQDPRDTDHDVERWALSTVRIGAVLKFGRGKPALPAPPAVVPPRPADVRFSVRAPATVVAVRRIHEVFPLRNYVYFDEGTNGGALEFSVRYTRLGPAQAAAFREARLQDDHPAGPTGRTVRQMAVYHHILNIVGDRLRRYPGSSITLVGLSARQGPRLGRARAENVKHYLMRSFGIDAARIAVDEREEPAPPLGRTPGELAMLRAENQRVEILSSSAEMLLQVGEGERFMLRPVEIEGETPGTDSVVFITAPAAPPPHSGLDTSSARGRTWTWTLTITDDTGAVRRFGPFLRSRETVPAPLLLGGRSHASFTAVMTGQFDAAEGNEASVPVTRQAAFTLSQRHKGIHATLRYGILFDIDQARAVSSYDRFLATEVAPRITDTSTVFIRGRTDVVTDEAYNLKLSKGRAEGVERVLEAAARAAGRRGVRFRASWSGEDPAQAPYGNEFPEERNYNRTVIIDIIPE